MEEEENIFVKIMKKKYAGVEPLAVDEERLLEWAKAEARKPVSDPPMNAHHDHELYKKYAIPKLALLHGDVPIVVEVPLPKRRHRQRRRS